MPRVVFTPNLAALVPSPPAAVEAATVREALEEALRGNDRLRSYVLDDQGRVRKHVTIFVDGRPVEDRAGLSDPLGGDSEVFVMQALSGGGHGESDSGKQEERHGQ